MFYKLKKSGLRGRVVDTLLSLYSKTCYRVKHQGKLSDLIFEAIGVLQGGNTSPLLFNKYLSDLKYFLDGATGICTAEEIIVHMLWADDLFMVSSDPSHAQKQLDGLSEYTSPNQMIANEIKTKYMVFGQCKNDFELKLNGKAIKKVESSKCLGIIVNSVKTITGDIFGEHPEYLKGKARQSIFSFYNRVKRIGYASPKCMFDLYKSLTQPILLYGSDIWGSSNKSVASVDLLLNWFLRMILCVKNSTCKPMLYGESGVVPPSVLCHQNVILYYIRLNNLPLGSVLKSVFVEMQGLQDISSCNNWCSNVFKLAENYGIDINNLEFTEKTKLQVKNVIKQKFISDWLYKINDSISNPGLRLYRMFKFDFKCESYLQNVKEFKFRKMFTKLRTNSHLLEIEHGRHIGKLEHQRLCTTCNVIESEYHFIMICPIYQELRTIFLQKIYDMFPYITDYCDYDKFLFMMGFDDSGLQCIFSKFIYNAFNVRSGLSLVLPPADDMCQSSGGGGNPSQA